LIKISFGSEFLKYLVDNKGAIHELNPMLSLPEERHQTYARLLAISELGIPLNIDATIRPEYWGLRADSRKTYQQIPLLDVLRLFNLYIERGQDNQWRIIFPDVIKDRIAFEEKLLDCEELPYWVSFSKLKRSQSFITKDKKQFLEDNW
jgi:hypothetical protein